MSALSLPALLRQTCERYASKPAMLAHDGSGFAPLLYRDLLTRVASFAGPIRALGLERGDRVVIQCENCIEWAFASWACQCLGVVVVPIYTTLPPDQSQYILKDSGAKVVLAGSPELAAKTEGVESAKVVLLKGAPDSIADQADQGLNAISDADFQASINAADATDVAMFIYTSGTTGAPKGAMLRHESFTVLCDGVLKELPVTKDDTFLCFLPMSHVYEAVAGQVLPISCGATIAYAQSLRTMSSDMLVVKPTIMLCVPRVLEAMRDRIMDAVEKFPPFRQKLFHWAHAEGLKKAKGEFAPFAGLLDKLVASKIRERTGGRIRFFVSGGATMPQALADFFGAFGVTVLQGYGLTETTAILSVNRPEKNRPWTVGPPISCNEVKLADDGEILMRGPARMVGYHNLPKETAEAIDADGWFHTGDIGRFEDDALVITDRKKDLIVLGNGKNVAPQPIENLLRESPLIADAVVVGDGRDHISALIVPDFDALRKRVQTQTDKALTDAELVETEAVVTLVKAEVSEINKRLADFEKVKRHRLLDHAFSMDTGELTPTMKVKRGVVLSRYADLIEWFYR